MRLDELTPATVWDAWAVAGVLALMLPPWLAVGAAIPVGAFWVSRRHILRGTDG